MGLLILLMFIGIPILEITLFIDVGERIGLFNTLLLVILTAIAGTTLLKWQGLSVLDRARECLHGNRFPMEEVFDGLCLIFAGALLLTPGFITDTLGFLMFFSTFRHILKSFGSRFIAKRANIHMSDANPSQSTDNGIIDGDYQDITEDKKTSNDKTVHKDC
jgi:UPF0716 protein FxsA